MGRPKKYFDTTDHEVGQAADIIVTSEDLINRIRKVDAVDPKLHKEYQDALAFMNEPMTVVVLESSDENAENPVSVGNNGRMVAFWRGVATKCKRKFVDSLIVKSTNVSTPESTTAANEQTFLIRQRSSLKYPFQVMEDLNPKGPEWLRGRLAEVM